MRLTGLKGRPKAALLVPILVLALGATGVAVAQMNNNHPRTDRVSATFNANVVQRLNRTCEGQDGAYGELVEGTYEGPIVGDPRLTGTLTVRAQSLLRASPDLGVPPDPNLGTAEGRFQIKQGDQVVAEGNMYGTVEGTQARIEGFVVGRTNTVQQGGKVFEGGALLGHFRASVDPFGNLSGGSFGGLDTEPSDPMVVQHGSCQAPTQNTSP